MNVARSTSSRAKRTSSTISSEKSQVSTIGTPNNARAEGDDTADDGDEILDSKLATDARDEGTACDGIDGVIDNALDTTSDTTLDTTVETAGLAIDDTLDTIGAAALLSEVANADVARLDTTDTPDGNAAGELLSETPGDALGLALGDALALGDGLDGNGDA